ncbi:MAG: hypothetical protein ACREOF_16395 [Gemmatimonadales bacterium]
MDRTPGSGARGRALSALLGHRAAVWAFAGAVAALTLAAQCASIAMPDIAFLLYAAGRVLDGATLYRDVVEINPPLIVALNLPVVWLARLTGGSDLLLYRVGTALALGLLLLVSRGLLRRHLPLGGPARRLVLLAAVMALFPMAGEDFGEREQLVLALLLPYLIVVAARLLERELPRAEAAAAGALGGLALALKPHFGLAWLAVELYARLRRPELRRRLTPEAVAAVAVLAAYGAGVALLTPDYLRLVKELGPAYAIYLRDPFYRLLLTGPGVALVLFALLAAVAARRASTRPELWGLLAVATAGCLLAGAAQEKGLRYHFYPAFALALLLLVVVAAEARERAPTPSERLYARVARPLVAAIILVLLGRTTLDLLGGGPAARRARAEFMDLVTFVRDRGQGEPLAVLSYHIGSAFPLVNYAAVPLASRYPHLWLFPVSYWKDLHAEAPLPYRPPGAMGARERYFFETVKEDLLRSRPRLLLVLRPARDVRSNGLRRLHYIRYFGQDAALASWFTGFQFAGPRGEYDVYERVATSAPRSAPTPSTAPGTADAKLARVSELRLGLLDGEMLAGTVIFLALAGWSAAARRRPPGRTAAPVPFPSS